MLENYEEETNEALSSYTKYRRPRMNRFAKYTEQETFKLLSSHGHQRFAQYLRLAFSTRFIPEIFILALILIIGGVLGAQLGARVSVKLKAEEIRILLAIIVLLVCLKLALDLIIMPTDLFSITYSARS